MGHYNLAPTPKLLQPCYTDNITFFLMFYEYEQAKKLCLELRVCQKYSPGMVSSAELCVINRDRVYGANVSAPLLVA